MKKLKLANRWDERLEKVRQEKMEVENPEAEQKDAESLEVQETEAEKEFNETDLKTTDESELTALEDLGSESDYTQFMSPEVSESIRKLALRKLFSGAEFNITDGLDDYDEDYTSFATLGNVITQEMKLKQKTKLEKRAKEMEEVEENVEAREKAFAAVEEVSVEPTSMVPLLSSGNLLIIGKDETPIMQALTSLKESPLTTSVLRIGRGDEEDFDGIKVIYSQNLEV
ncbi:MAG TPA: hypothetical protein DEA86_05320, partial [Deltaproteobacteria bacterium]|nr:hypothetical protein [Deltaproteobacteria bacterium]